MPKQLTGDTGLGIYPVGEHFLVYLPIDRQVRDVRAILQANHFRIQRALDEALRGTNSR